MKHGTSALVFALLSAACVAGCTSGRASAASPASERPTVIRFSYAPGIEEPQAQSIRLERLKSYLTDRLKVDVELYKTSAGYGTVIEAMQIGRASCRERGWTPG